MAKIEKDKYFTPPELAKELIQLTYDTIGDDWERIIEPAAGDGSFLQFLPKNTIAYDIEPQLPNIIQSDYRMVELPYIEKSLVIGNPPFGRGNSLSRQFVLKSLKHSPYIAFIQPISQLDNNRTMSNTELILSKDLGKLTYSDKKNIHTCFNIYHYKLNGHKENNYEIPNLVWGHIYRIGKGKNDTEEYVNKWDYRIAAWGSPIKLLKDGEICSNEVAVKATTPEMKKWLDDVIKYDYSKLIQNVSGNTYSLPIWRVQKYLYEKYNKK